MTESNKKRIVKYGNLLRQKTTLTFEGLSNYMKIDINADYVYRTAINCAISEVEEIIDILTHDLGHDITARAINENIYQSELAELAELKSMLQ
jgi:hypothetical protein